MMPWHYQLPPEVTHYRPHLWSLGVTTTTLGPGINTGHWEQLASDTCQWRAGLGVRRWCLGLGQVWAWPSHPGTSSSRLNVSRGEKLSLYNTASNMIRGEAPRHENLNKRHNYSVFPAKKLTGLSPLSLSISSWVMTTVIKKYIFNYFVIILGKFMAFCKESED